MGIKKKSLRKTIKKSSVNLISLVYGSEKIEFNLNEELAIKESQINKEIQTQPSYFGFLSLMKVRLERIKNDKKGALEKEEARLFLRYKSKSDPSTNRIYSNDSAEALVKTHKLYQKALKEYNKAMEDYSIISSCVEAFYQRSTLIQSLSANVRKEMNT